MCKRSPQKKTVLFGTIVPNLWTHAPTPWKREIWVTKAPWSISWVNERWDRSISRTCSSRAKWALRSARAHFHHNGGTCPSHPVTQHRGLQHADITISNIVSSKCSQITYNWAVKTDIGDMRWYLESGCCCVGQASIWRFPTINFKGLTRAQARPKGEESFQQALSQQRSQSKGNSEKSREEEL